MRVAPASGDVTDTAGMICSGMLVGPLYVCVFLLVTDVVVVDGAQEYSSVVCDPVSD